MTEHEIYLEQYDWTVRVCYHAGRNDAMRIRKHLRELGCHGVPLEDACNLMIKGELNKELTYSNMDKRESVVVIGEASSYPECINSIGHEMLHVVQHISDCFLLDMYGEEVCYLHGKLMQASMDGLK